MSCQKCNSERVLDVSGKTSDCCSLEINSIEHHGYVLPDLGVGKGDYLKFQVCLNCGQMQGKYPLKMSSLEKQAEENKAAPFKKGDYVEFNHGANEELCIGIVQKYDGDNFEVEIDVIGTWDESAKRHFCSLHRTNKFYNKHAFLDQNDVTLSTKEW
jgi:hypothetical protein